MDVQRLKEIRQDKDLYQKDIAKILNTSQKQYSLYETGMRLIPIDKLEKLAKYYDTSIDYLIGLTNERKPYPKSIIILSDSWLLMEYNCLTFCSVSL